jgi:hypothetical protein
VTALSKHAVPKVHYRLRRRRYNDTSWLIDHNDWYELDELTDAVWLACEQGLTVEQIVESVAARQGLPLNEALAATIDTLARFQSLGFLEWEDPVGCQNSRTAN